MSVGERDDFLRLLRPPRHRVGMADEVEELNIGSDTVQA
jgi:hypothetical protein